MTKMHKLTVNCKTTMVRARQRCWSKTVGTQGHLSTSFILQSSSGRQRVSLYTIAGLISDVSEDIQM